MSDEELEQMIADWPEEDKQLAREFHESDKQMQAWTLIGEHLKKMPSDPVAWLDRTEADLPGALSKVPKPVAEEFGPLITDQIRLCRRALCRSDEQHTRMLFAVLAENVDRLAFNINSSTVRDTKAKRSEGGKVRHADDELDKQYVTEYYHNHRHEFKSTRAMARAIDEAEPRHVFVKFDAIYRWLLVLDKNRSM